MMLQYHVARTVNIVTLSRWWVWSPYTPRRRLTFVTLHHNLKPTKSQRQLLSVFHISLTLALNVVLTLNFGQHHKLYSSNNVFIAALLKHISEPHCYAVLNVPYHMSSHMSLNCCKYLHQMCI